jgi:hypothetical protein
VHDRDVVAITASFRGPDPPKNVANLRDESFVRVPAMSDSSERPWIRYDFKSRRIFPTGCSITTWLQHDGNRNEVIPLPYTVEIRLRKRGFGYWRESGYRGCERWCEPQVCQAIRLIFDPGDVPCGSSRLCIASFEVFGCIFEPNDKRDFESLMSRDCE